MKHLRVDHVEEIHRRVVEQAGGDPSIRALKLLDSAVAETRWPYFPTVAEKAAALAFSLCNNHPFADGNKRTSYVAMKMFLRRNGYEPVAAVDEAERVFVELAAGTIGREEFVAWVAAHIGRKK